MPNVFKWIITGHHMDDSDNYKFSRFYHVIKPLPVVDNTISVGKIRLSEPSLSRVETFQSTLDHSSVKFICAILLLTHILYFLTNIPKYISS